MINNLEDACFGCVCVCVCAMSNVCLSCVQCVCNVCAACVFEIERGEQRAFRDDHVGVLRRDRAKRGNGTGRARVERQDTGLRWGDGGAVVRSCRRLIK